MGDKLMPILKWVGGKTQLLDEIVKRLPEEGFNRYFEPFIGGGALLFHLSPDNAVINDFNTELINYYNVVKRAPKTLIKELKKHKNEEVYFYDQRDLDRSVDYAELTDIQRASRFQFLNKTAYSGLYRVNLKGEFNTPYGKYKNPNIVNEDRILAVHTYFKEKKIKILNTDFETAVHSAKEGDFVYFDPPYDVADNVSKFTGYTSAGFNRDSQLKLKELCDSLNKKNVKFIVSNSNTDFINELYKEYTIDVIKANRSINSDGNNRRKSAEEVLIKNY
jgi:DNA adenine methylase